MQLQKFTGPLPAAGGSLPEESTLASVESLRASRGRKFHLFEKRIKKGQGKIPALIFLCLSRLNFSLKQKGNQQSVNGKRLDEGQPKKQRSK